MYDNLILLISVLALQAKYKFNSNSLKTLNKLIKNHREIYNTHSKYIKVLVVKKWASHLIKTPTEKYIYIVCINIHSIEKIEEN